MIGSDPDLYFDLWTRKEAVLKLLGTGLHLRPDHARVGLPETERKRAIVVWADRVRRRACQC
jgi:phosphopantetheinyl transferase